MAAAQDLQNPPFEESPRVPTLGEKNAWKFLLGKLKLPTNKYPDYKGDDSNSYYPLKCLIELAEKGCLSSASSCNMLHLVRHFYLPGDFKANELKKDCDKNLFAIIKEYRRSTEINYSKMKKLENVTRQYVDAIIFPLATYWKMSVEMAYGRNHSERGPGALADYVVFDSFVAVSKKPVLVIETKKAEKDKIDENTVAQLMATILVIADMKEVNDGTILGIATNMNEWVFVKYEARQFYWNTENGTLVIDKTEEAMRIVNGYLNDLRKNDGPAESSISGMPSVNDTFGNIENNLKSTNKTQEKKNKIVNPKSDNYSWSANRNLSGNVLASYLDDIMFLLAVFLNVKVIRLETEYRQYDFVFGNEKLFTVVDHEVIVPQTESILETNLYEWKIDRNSKNILNWLDLKSAIEELCKKIDANIQQKKVQESPQ